MKIKEKSPLKKKEQKSSKVGKKRKFKEISKGSLEKGPEPLPAVRSSDEPVEKKRKWINKQRVLVLASRGISHRDRHLMEDIKTLMPHHKTEPKMERSKTLTVLNEVCETKNCNKAILFEGRKKKDVYMWLSNVPNGPSAKFLVESIFTMGELKLTGNCLRGSRPLLSFDPSFQEAPHYNLLKELLTQIFGVPKHHPKSQPFFDHVYTFTVLDNRIWFRNFQILSEDGALVEIGPRFVLNPVKIFAGSFGGEPLWENPNYVSPTKYRIQLKMQAKNKYENRIQQKTHKEATKPTEAFKPTPLDDLFQDDPLKKAHDLVKKQKKAEKEQIQENGISKEKIIKKKKPIKKVKITKNIDLKNGVEKIKNKIKKVGVSINKIKNKKIANQKLKLLKKKKAVKK